FGSKLIRSSVRVVGAAFGGDRKRGFVTETCIIECARAMHFSSANVGVPVGDGPEPRPGMKIHAGQAISRRNQSAGSLPIGSEAFTVFIQFGIKTARTPACKNLLHGRYIYAKQVGERLQVGRKGHNGADIQVASSPTVQAVADPGRKPIVDGGM